MAAAYPVCGWIGSWQVKRFLAELEAAGHAVDPEKYYVPASSPERDVFLHPAMIREIEDPKVKGLWLREPQPPGLVRSKPRIQPEFAVASDVREWFAPPENDEKEAARRLLAELHEAIERMEEIRPALERPEAAWEVRWVSNEFTYWKTVPDAATSMFRLRFLLQFQAERVTLHLAAGDTAAAAECVESMADVCRHFLESRPSMVSVILADVAIQEIERSVWQGVVRGVWTDGHLAAFEKLLAALDPQAAASRCFLGEVAFMRWKSEALEDEVGEGRSKRDLHWKEGWEWDRKRIAMRSRALWRGLRPQGIDLMKVATRERLLIGHLSCRNGSPRSRFLSEELTFFKRQHDGSPLALHVFDKGWTSEQADLDASVWQGLQNFTAKVLAMETRIALTRAGIALERHHMKDGKTAETLDALVPDYLVTVPPDPFGTGPLRYRRQADGSPHLWSVGPDLIDEGGLPHINRTTQGDLVWITRPIPGFTKKDLRR